MNVYLLYTIKYLNQDHDSPEYTNLGYVVTPLEAQELLENAIEDDGLFINEGTTKNLSKGNTEVQFDLDTYGVETLYNLGYTEIEIKKNL